MTKGKWKVDENEDLGGHVMCIPKQNEMHGPPARDATNGTTQVCVKTLATSITVATRFHLR